MWLWSGRPRDWGTFANAVVVADSASSASHTVERVTIRTDRGRRLDCLVRRPAAGTSLPAVLVAGGQRTGRRAALLVGPAFTGVAMACDYPWSDPGDRSALSILFGLPRIRADIVATPRAHSLAAGWLARHPAVDSARLAGVGVSLGVPTIAAWAAADQRARAAGLVYGGARLDLVFDRALARRLPNGAVRAPVSWLIGRLLGPLEPARTVPLIPPRPVFVAVATGDERIPAASTEALIAAAGPGATVVRFGGAHMRSTDRELLSMLTDSTALWLSRVFSPAAADGPVTPRH